MKRRRLLGLGALGLLGLWAARPCRSMVDDWVFLRPQPSEGLLDDFDELRLLRHGRLVGRWTPLRPA